MHESMHTLHYSTFPSLTFHSIPLQITSNHPSIHTHMHAYCKIKRSESSQVMNPNRLLRSTGLTEVTIYSNDLSGFREQAAGCNVYFRD